MEIIINACFGGFGLSELALNKYRLLSGNPDISPYEISRTDSILIEIIKELGEAGNGDYAELKIIEIPDDIDWEIDEYDGMEKAVEVHRYWQ